MQAGWSPESIRAAIEQNPNSAGGLLKAFEERRKSEMEYAKGNAEIRSKEQDALSKEQERLLKMADILGNEAGWLADHPNLTPSMVGKYAKKVAGSGLQGVLTMAPFQDWTNAEASKGYLRQIQNTMFDTKDRIASAETERSHRANEGHQAATLGETIRNNDRIAGDALADRQQRWGIAGMTDARQRELNKITQEGNNGQRISNIEMKLSDDYRQQSKGFQETAGAINKARTALETADTNPGSALAAGTAFMKLLDPNSVVRESELGMALNASGWFDKATNAAQRLQSQVMTSAQKKNMKAAMDDLWNEVAATQRQVDKQYMAKIERYGGNPSNVLLDLGQNSPSRSSQPSGGTSGLFSAPAGSGVDFVYKPRGR